MSSTEIINDSNLNQSQNAVHQESIIVIIRKGEIRYCSSFHCYLKDYHHHHHPRVLHLHFQAGPAERKEDMSF